MENPKWINELLFSKKYFLLRHAFFWIFIYLDEFLSLIGITSPYEDFHLIIFEWIGDMMLVYFNIYYLLPKLLLKKRILSYGLATILCVIIIAVFNYYIYESHQDSDFLFLEYFVSSLASNAALVGFAAVIRFFKLSNESQLKIQSLKETNLKTELAYLKNQVNPHFLFNTLNNVYIMSRKKMDELPETIMQLSDLLRYQLYECDVDYVSLTDEIDYLKNYIHLEKLRRSDLDIRFNVEGTVANAKIAPLIFLPFVENAFKYSLNSDGTPGKISIEIQVTDKEIQFSCENSIGDIPANEFGGIGLNNAKRRLELVYPDNCDLNIYLQDDFYFVKLSLKNND